MACVWFLHGFAAEAVEVQLKPLSVCRHAIIRLGDVASFHGADATLADELAQLELFPAPPSGQTKFVRASDIRQRLRTALGGTPVEVTGAHDLRIRAESAADLGGPASRATQPAGSPGEAAQKKEQLRVVASRPLKRGDRIRPTDVALESGADSPSLQPTLRTLDTAIGMEVTRPVEAGHPLTSADVRPLVVVKARDVVTVRALAAGVRITTQAQAIDAGALGDVVVVESLDSKQRYSARVSGFREVEVYARGPSVSEEPAAPGADGHPRRLATRDRRPREVGQTPRTAWKGRRAVSEPGRQPRAGVGRGAESSR